MNLKNYYWYFQSVLPRHLCDDIIKYGLSHTKQTATIGGMNQNVQKKPLTCKETKALKKIRNSSVTWLEDPWISKELYPYLHQANSSSGWNFEFDYCEAIQFTHYQLNQHYDWHCDSNHKPYVNHDNKKLDGKIRKLSMTISLSDATEYEGGEFEFNFLNKLKSKSYICNEIKPKGSIVVFPSFVHHRVRPVTAGTRYSLVCWLLGRPFK